MLKRSSRPSQGDQKDSFLPEVKLFPVCVDDDGVGSAACYQRVDSVAQFVRGRNIARFPAHIVPPSPVIRHSTSELKSSAEYTSI